MKLHQLPTHALVSSGDFLNQVHNVPVFLSQGKNMLERHLRLVEERLPFQDHLHQISPIVYVLWV